MRTLHVIRMGAALLATGAALACSGGSNYDERVTNPLDEARFQRYPCGVVWEVQERLGRRLACAAPMGQTLADYPLTADGTFVSPLNNDCTDRIAARLGALCLPCLEDPGECEPLVRAIFDDPPAVCSQCGDGVCLDGEDATNCQRDCAPRCGDGTCAGGELAISCPVDCAVACGDGRCAGGETPETCIEDCRFSAGDGICEPGETPESSPEDCFNVACGDFFCQPWEDALRCPGDCCFAPQCSQEGTFCLDAQTLGRCDLTADLGCPAAVVQETCPNGCRRDGRGAWCRTCDDVIADVVASGISACTPGDQPVCGNGSIVVLECLPIPGYPSCYG